MIERTVAGIVGAALRLPRLTVALGLVLAAGSVANRRTRTALLVSLALLAATGWIGVASRRFYAAPHFVEPWRSVAQQVAQLWRSDATVISNHPVFMFNFAYAIGTPWTTHNWTPETSVNSPPAPRVYHTSNWAARGETPLPGRIVLVKGAALSGVQPDTDWTQQQLERLCSRVSVDREVPDIGFAWKQRFFPQAGQVPWRIEIRQYDCGTEKR